MSDVLDFLQEETSLKVEPKKWMVDGTHRLILCTQEMLPKVIDECIASGRYGLDLETTGLDNRVFDGEETVDKIVGCCLAPNETTGYYIPLRHKVGTEANLSWTSWKAEMTRLFESPSVAVLHNSKFDLEFLQFCGGAPLGNFEDVKKWDDTLVLAYLRDPRANQFGLKFLSRTELGMEQIELPELFLEDQRGDKLDFSTLDPKWLPVTWYAAADAICTLKLYPKLSAPVLAPTDGNSSQALIYSIEKICLTATRWMERARIFTDQDKVRELVRIGQVEWIEALEEVYRSASELVGRDVRPGFFRLMSGEGGEGIAKFDPQETSPSYMDRIDVYRREADRLHLDPVEKVGKKVSVKSVTKTVPSLVNKGSSEDVNFPLVYDILSPQQLGSLLRECKVPGLTVTEKSGQVATSKDELDRVLEEQGGKYPFAGKIKRFREVGKALGTYLVPLLEDCAPDGTIRAKFDGHNTDTGRFSAEGSKRPKIDGGTRFPVHGTPATYDPKRPACLGRIRECIRSRPGRKIVAIDFSGVELRIVTNMSLEPKWVREFFRCSGCDHMFPNGDGESTPQPPPPFCPICGSDKIGDLHSLTAITLYGEDAPKRADWKVLRGNGKTVNFALCYGGGGTAVDNAIGCGKQEGWRIKDQFDKSYRGLKGWWNQQHAFARRFKYVLTAFGRRYPVPDIDHENGFFRSKAERNSTNGPIQGSSADITKLSMGLIYKECSKRGWLTKVSMIITMHDELVFEIDDDILAEAIDCFVGIMNRNQSLLKLRWPIPLTSDVEIGLDWTVPWDLKKMRRSGKWPAELKGLFPEAANAPEAPPEEKAPKKEEKKVLGTRVWKLGSLSFSEADPLARLLTSTPKNPALLKVEGPSGEDLTPALMTVWGGLLPEVESEG